MPKYQTVILLIYPLITDYPLQILPEFVLLGHQEHSFPFMISNCVTSLKKLNSFFVVYCKFWHLSLTCHHKHKPIKLEVFNTSLQIFYGILYYALFIRFQSFL